MEKTEKNVTEGPRDDEIVELTDEDLTTITAAKGSLKTPGQITVPDDSLYASGHVGIWLPQDSPINS